MYPNNSGILLHVLLNSCCSDIMKFVINNFHSAGISITQPAYLLRVDKFIRALKLLYNLPGVWEVKWMMCLVRLAHLKRNSWLPYKLLFRTQIIGQASGVRDWVRELVMQFHCFYNCYQWVIWKYFECFNMRSICCSFVWRKADVPIRRKCCRLWFTECLGFSAGRLFAYIVSKNFML